MSRSKVPTPRNTVKYKRGCLVKGCTRPFSAKGMCYFHYRRKKRGKDLDAPVRMRGVYLTCTFEGCEKDHAAHGLCNQHARQKRQGKPLTPLQGRDGAPMRDLLAAVSSDVDTCILWTHATCANGYGRVELNGKQHVVSRIVLELSCVPLPNKEDVFYACHLPVVCHNASCINPKHLYWGTPLQNNMDRHADGTMPMGVDHHYTSLTEEQVRQIRKDKRNSHRVSKDYPVSDATVTAIRQRKTWKHLP